MTTSAAPTRAHQLLGVQRALAGAITVFVLVLAVIAGRSIFGPWNIEIHGWIGNGVFVLAIANLAVAIARRATTAELTVAALIGGLTFAQIGLGYVGREQLEAAAWHVPNGVLLMALSTYQFAGLRFRTAVASNR